MFDANGKDCRVSARAERSGSVSWTISFTPSSPSPSPSPSPPSPFVVVVITAALVQQSLAAEDDMALLAVGNLYGDEKTVLTDAHNVVVGDSRGQLVYQPKLAVSGVFTGARLLAGTSTIRIDCSSVLPMWIECDLGMPGSEGTSVECKQQ